MTIKMYYKLLCLCAGMIGTMSCGESSLENPLSIQAEDTITIYVASEFLQADGGDEALVFVRLPVNASDRTVSLTASSGTLLPRVDNRAGTNLKPAEPLVVEADSISARIELALLKENGVLTNEDMDNWLVLPYFGQDMWLEMLH